MASLRSRKHTIESSFVAAADTRIGYGYRIRVSVQEGRSLNCKLAASGAEREWPCAPKKMAREKVFYILPSTRRLK